MSLLEAAREDVAGAIRQDAEIRLFEEGIAKGGRGIDHNKRRAVEYKEQMKRARAYGNELEAGAKNTGSFCDISYRPNKFLPVTGRHRPPEKKSKRCMNAVVGADSLKLADKHRQTAVKKAKGKCAAAQQSRFFHLTLFSMISNLKKCYGCGGIFKPVNKKPPKDLILKHFCNRRYKNKDGVEVVAPIRQAAYCHLQLDCARKVVATMEIADIVIHDDVRQKLTQKHY
jgi:hypothetical protein